MTHTEEFSPAGEDMSPVADIRSALAGFVNDIRGFQSDISKRLGEQEKKMTHMERKSLTRARPHLGAVEPGAPHQKAFNAYLRRGDDDALRGLDLEGKSLSVAVAGDGGYLVDPQTAEAIKSTLSSTASLRAIANVVTIEATSFDVLIDHGEVGHGWATESSTVTETDTPKIDRITIPLHELSALPKASQRLLDDSAFDVESWLAGRIADKFARAEAAAFVNGNGTDKPKGFMNHPEIANDSWSWGNIGYVTTGVAGDFGSPGPLVDLVYALGAQYRANGTFVMNSRTAGDVRKLTDANGRFLWTDSIAAQEPARLLGYPVLVCEDMPDVADGANAVAFGDFSAGYTIAERPDLRVLRDPFSAKPHVLFYATKRVGGDVSDFAAIKLLKFAAA